jgi:hypothetical protein
VRLTLVEVDLRDLAESLAPSWSDRMSELLTLLLPPPASLDLCESSGGACTGFGW